MIPARRKTRSAPAEIIHGITLDVQGRDLVVQIAARIEWHRSRQQAIAAQLQRLSGGEQDGGQPGIAINQRDSLRTGLERNLAEHQQRTQFLVFLCDHMAPHQVYRLDSLDFRMIEIMPD